ncbi:MAG: four helix bundle protein [Chitinophagaceae bacterium]|nr:four helix bundle protein [Chitinophagaceae bacterium]
MFSYENLEVYKKAFVANQEVFRFLKGNRVIPLYAKSQLGRASVSIMLNIAEGSAKLSKKDRRNFYTTARGSTFESACLVTFLTAEEAMPAELNKKLCSLYEEISKMLFVMIRNLDREQ